MILAGDVGGTKTRLALFDAARPPRVARIETFRSAASPSLESMVDEFLRDPAEPVAAAAFGVAGAVVGDAAVLPNLPWTVDARRLSQRLRGSAVFLMNDLEAFAWAVGSIPETGTARLLDGAPGADGNRGVIAAGTGLGEAMIVGTAARPLVVASEAGHADFAPRSDLDVELLRWLRGRFGHVSWERVVSGPGLANVHAFLTETGRGAEPPSITEAIREGDSAALISTAAHEGRSERCALAMDLFTAAYGAEAGNLALRAVATGGVFLGGGIAPKIVPWLRREPFRAAFLDKGRLSPLLARVGVEVILDDRAALVGAALRAMSGAT